MSDRKAKYIINDIYNVVVKKIIYVDVIHRVLDNNHAIGGKQSSLFIADIMFH